jgi:hypothetical protein
MFLFLSDNSVRQTSDVATLIFTGHPETERKSQTDEELITRLRAVRKTLEEE